jgi:type I restriction enzyme S subunit
MSKTKLKNITTKIGAGATPTGGQSSYQEEGIALIRSQNVLDFRFSRDGLAFINEEQAKALNNVTVEENDVLLNITGDSIARVCVVPKEVLPARVNQHVSIIRCNKEIDSRYVHYYLQYLKPYLLKICGVGGTRNALTKEAIEKLEIEIRENHTGIAAVLSALDAKIELNQRINAELESMAKTLYDYWFVQFEFPTTPPPPPAIAGTSPKSDGTSVEFGGGRRGYKSAGGKMVWSEALKREIPLGWEVGSLLDIADYMNGLPCQKFRPTGNEFLRVIKIREMHEGFSESTELVRPEIPHKAIIENGDVLFSWSASLEVQIWSGGKGALNQHIFKVTSEKYPKSFYYYQLLNYLQHFKMMAENRKTTMGHITQEHLQQSRIALPPKELTMKLEKIIAPIFEKKMVNEIETQTLTALRDWLLPMLMNGQITVKT